MAVASSDFIALCRSQVLLLTRAFEATSTVVYLAQQADSTAELSLVPLVAYPETANPWAGLSESLAAIADQAPLDESPSDIASTLADPLGASPAEGSRATGLAAPSASMQVNNRSQWPTSSVHEPATSAPPLVLPLMHEGVALGVMVSTREALPWSHNERQQAEQVANTLALAWVLDQRGQWLQQQFQQRYLTQVDQSDTFHNLLHQFRNPLTALQTFGRLLVKRIPSDDPNQPIAEGIVRESRRLQDLAQTFDSAVAQGDEALQPQPTVPPTTGLLLPGLTGVEADSLDLSPEAEPTYGGSSTSLTARPGQNSWPHLGRAPVLAPGRIMDVVTPLMQSVLAIAQDRDLVVIQNLPPNLPEVWMDAPALGEVLSNLLDNALKYAPPGALLWVTGGLVQTLAGQFFQGIAIGDTGQGIPGSDQPHIFERHFRGVQAEGEIPGTGLGLAIAQDLVQAMGGHLDLVSPVQADQWIPLPEAEFNQGQGTMFIVWLRTV